MNRTQLRRSTPYILGALIAVLTTWFLIRFGADVEHAGRIVTLFGWASLVSSIGVGIAFFIAWIYMNVRNEARHGRAAMACIFVVFWIVSSLEIVGFTDFLG